MERFIEFAELILSFESAASLSDVYAPLQNYAKRIGYIRMSVFDLTRSPQRFTDALIHSHLSQSRIQNWEPIGNFWQHPLVEKSRESIEPFPLSSVDFGEVSELHCPLGPGVNANGAAGGWVVPVHEKRLTQAFVTFVDSKPATNSQAEDLLKLAVHAAWSQSKSLADHVPDEKNSTHLTIREVECLRWAAKGKTHAEVGETIGISPRTVRFHIQNAKAKMNVDTRIQAVTRMLKDQFIKAPARKDPKK